MPPRIYQCTVCGARPRTIEELMRCSNCLGTVRYCSRACQKSDWPRHRVDCRSTDPLMRVRGGGLKRILELLNLRDRVVLSSCSKSLQTYVFVTSKSLWTEIDFGKVPRFPCVRISITDDGLRALLQRADARNVTKVLCLNGCASVEGYGLDAIRGSCVLEEIDLRLQYWHRSSAGETGLNDAFVLKVLSSMPPLSFDSSKTSTNATTHSVGLSVVKFRRQYNKTSYFSSFHGGISKWLLRFENSRDKQIVTTETKCNHCNKALAQIHASRHRRLLARCLCVDCNKYCCGVGGCPQVAICSMCTHSFCKDCRYVGFCDECLQDVCEDCSYLTGCSVCKQVVCDACCDGVHCNKCDKWFCEKPACNDKTKWCDVCEDVACHDCNPIEYCNICEKRCCRDCRGASLKCQTCNASSCGECGHVNTCVGCQGVFCQGCQSMGKCNACDQWWCEKCETSGTACGGQEYYRCEIQRLSHADFIWQAMDRVCASKGKKSEIVSEVNVEWLWFTKWSDDKASFRDEWHDGDDAVNAGVDGMGGV